MITKKIKTKDGRVFIEIPKEFDEKLPNTIDLIHVRDQVFLILPESTSLKRSTPSTVPEPKHTLTKDELDLLKKLSTIKFKDRTKKYVDKKLSQTEKKILDSLIRKGVVELYTGKGYARFGGVYNIKEDVFKSGKTERKTLRSTSKKGGEQPLPGVSLLSSEREAKEFSKRYEREIKEGRLLGIRGFDKKYYVIRKDYFDKYSQLILKLLEKGPLTLDEIAKRTKLPIHACKGILLLLSEEGQVYESTDNRFTIA